MALLAAVLVQPIYRFPIGWAPTAIITGMAIVATLRPYHALLIFAGIAPLAGVIFVLTRAGFHGMHFEEALTLAFISGWSARRIFRPQSLALGSALRVTVGILIAVTLASAVVTSAIAAAEEPGIPTVQFLWTLAFREYLIAANALTYPMLFLEGLVLMLIVADTCAGDAQRRDGVVRMFVAGAAGVASLNLLRLVMASAAREDPWGAFLQYLATVRVSVQYSDVNAAGSYFALALVVAIALTVRRRLWAFCSVLIALGLWTSGSRTALAATPLALTIIPLAMNQRLRSRRLVLTALAALVVAGMAAWWWYPAGRNETVGNAMDYRVLTARAAIHLTASNPLFGVGLGRFFPLAEPYVGRPENAHNNFLQVLAELGIPGLLLFLAVLALSMLEAWRNGPNGPAGGLFAGISAFLMTCLAGHPLLIPSVAYAFWVAVGLAAVPTGGSLPVSRIGRRAALAIVVFFVAALPFRVTTAVRQADLEHASVGLSKWQREPDGSRFRWAGGHSSFFLPSSARAVRLSLRHGGIGPQTIDVRISVDGREANGVRLEEDAGWRSVRILLARKAESVYSRIELQVGVPGMEGTLDMPVSDAGGVLMVRRPEVER